MFLLSSLSNIIIDSVSPCAGGSVVNWSVVRGFSKAQEKIILIFSILRIKKKQIWLSEAVTRIFVNFKQNKPRAYCNFKYFFVYKKLRQTFRKSIRPFKEFFLVNSFIGVFWGTLRQVSQQLPAKHHSILVSRPQVFSFILLVQFIYLVFPLVKILPELMPAGKKCQNNRQQPQPAINWSNSTIKTL